MEDPITFTSLEWKLLQQRLENGNSYNNVLPAWKREPGRQNLDTKRLAERDETIL